MSAMKTNFCAGAGENARFRTVPQVCGDFVNQTARDLFSGQLDKLSFRRHQR